MHLNSTFRTKPSEKAKLFNNYFYDQFSGPSDYNINIGWSNDQVFDIDLDQNKVRKLLLNINSNKASGPDGIHGKILKNCANTLAYPLSKFRTTQAAYQRNKRLPMLCLSTKKEARTISKITALYHLLVYL